MFCQIDLDIIFKVITVAGLFITLFLIFVESNMKIKLSPLSMILIIIAIILVSAMIILHYHSDEETDSSLPPISESAPPTHSATIVESDDPGNSELPSNPPQKESQAIINYENKTELSEPPTLPPTDFFPNPSVQSVICTLTATCIDNPLFTDYYIILSNPESNFSTRYFFYDLPAPLTDIIGEYNISVYQASTDTLIKDIGIVNLDGHSNFPVSFCEPIHTFFLNVYCENDPTYNDYYVVLYPPSSSWMNDMNVILYYPEESPIELSKEPGLYHLSVYDSSSGDILLDTAEFSVPVDDHPGLTVNLPFVSPYPSIEHNIILDTKHYSGEYYCSHSSAKEGENISLNLISDCEYMVLTFIGDIYFSTSFEYQDLLFFSSTSTPLIGDNTVNISMMSTDIVICIFDL